MPRGQFDAEVLANERLCDEHFRLTLAVEDFPPTWPGQFVQLACRSLEGADDPQVLHEGSPHAPPRFAGEDLTATQAFLRRPFSLAGRRDHRGRAELSIIHRVVGVGTDWLARRMPGQRVNVLGPLGNTFAMPPDDGIAMLVGGGVGIPPMLYLAEALAGKKAIAFCGALSRRLIPLNITDAAPPPKPDSVSGLYNVTEFSKHGIPGVLCTDDGSWGYRGYVTDALGAHLDQYYVGQEALRRLTIYTCGSEIMMKKVAAIAAARGVECQVAVERAMACGMGTCQSCCIRVRKSDPAAPPLAGREWAWRLACTDGPVFRGADLLW